MGVFDRFKNTSAPPKPKVDWDAFVTESIAEHRASAPAPLAPEAPRQPFLERHLFGPMRRTAITLAIVAACIFLIPLLIIVVIGLAVGDSSTTSGGGFKAADAGLRITRDRRQSKQEPASTGPKNRDPDKPPGSRRDYEWVNDKRVKNDGDKPGYWRHK